MISYIATYLNPYLTLESLIFIILVVLCVVILDGLIRDYMAKGNFIGLATVGELV